MTPDELENLISQSIDQMLPAQQQAQFEAELARDPGARALMDEYSGVHELLLNAEMPEIDDEELAMRISASIAEADERARHEIYSFPIWARWAAGLAAAASVLLAIGAWVHLSGPRQARQSLASDVGSPVVQVLEVGRPVNRQPISEVAIGPRPGMDAADLTAREALTAHRSSVAIDSAIPAQDNHRLFY